MQIADGRWQKGLLLSCLISVALPAWGSDYQLKEGNRLFKGGHYDAALKNYNDALIDTPSSSILRFNMGDAAYAMGQFSDAEKHFREAGDSTPITGFRAAARYNQGNALFRQQKWKEAVEAYKDSLRANPKDENAKYNLGVALNVMKNPSKAPQQPKPQPGQNDKQKSGQKPAGENPQNATPRSGDMSKQDAERLLAAVGAGEPKKPKSQMKKPGVPHPDEDW